MCIHMCYRMSTLCRLKKKTYIKKYYYERPSVFKFLDLLQTHDKKKQLRNTALYLKLAEKSRLELTNRM